MQRFRWNLGLEQKSRLLRDRHYAKAKLSNGMSCVVISDPKTPTAGASLSIEAGSWLDGTFAGTAHFLEHMLFLGTKKYPSESDYERFIFDNNGSLNGYTANDHSLYYFSGLSPQSLSGALDRFSRFFYEPMFNPSCIGREMNAVHEEFKRNCTNDLWRTMHVRKQIADQRHPFSQFNTGNLETMQEIDQNYLRDWFERHYIANAMNLVVHGREPVQELLEFCEHYFGQVKGGFYNTRHFGKIFPGMEGKILWVEPLKDIKHLHLTWEISEDLVDMDTKSASLVASLLGHEGKGSLLSQLKSKGLVESLSASGSVVGYNNCEFNITVSLTDVGRRHYQTVIDEIRAALHLFEERNQMSKIKYEYMQRDASISTKWTAILRREGLESFPERSLTIQTFDPTRIASVFEALLKDPIVTIEAKGGPTTYQEKWMGAKYGFVDMESNSVLSNVQVPQKNAFMPNQLYIVEKDQQKPEKIIDTTGSQLYYFPDGSFDTPECSMVFNVKTPQIRAGDPQKQLLSALYNRFVGESLNELTYDASLAGLDYNCWIHNDTGIAVSVDGYNQKAVHLLDQVFARVVNPTLDPQLFKIFMSALKRSLENASKNQPLQQATEKFSSLMMDEYCTVAELSKAVDSISFESLEAFCKTLFQERLVEGYCGGSLNHQDAIEAHELVMQHVQGSDARSPIKRPRVIQPSDNEAMIHVPVEGNALLHTIGYGHRTEDNRSGWELLSKLLKEPFYSELRTVQQTGYVVQSQGIQLDKQLFVQLMIQSSRYQPLDLLDRTIRFMDAFTLDLNNQQSHNIKKSTIDRLKEPFDKLVRKQRFYNYLAYEEEADFDLVQKRLYHLQSMELQDVVRFANSATSQLAVMAQGHQKTSSV
ncbi:Metalloenzyme, LuxS/M16 peptidase-like protein [Gorgonomyces haynaldii]|nr:Metalloenzyme, LuxS/M16 peptidase-like protein [Gorgonomyces haynaldii]